MREERCQACGAEADIVFEARHSIINRCGGCYLREVATVGRSADGLVFDAKANIFRLPTEDERQKRRSDEDARYMRKQERARGNNRAVDMQAAMAEAF